MFEEDRQHLCCLGISGLSVIVKVIMVEEEELYRKKGAKSFLKKANSCLSGWDQWH